MRAGLLALPTKGRVALVLAGLAVAAAILLGGASPGTAAPSSGIVVNEVYGGGGNTGATYTNDFIELRNRGTRRSSLDGWSVQYHSGSATRRLAGHAAQRLASRPAPSTWSPRRRAPAARTPLPHAAGHRHDRHVGHGGTVALVNGTTALTCSRLRGLPGRLVDLVGYGTAVINERRPARRRVQHRLGAAQGRRPTPTTTPPTSPPAPRPRAPPTRGGDGGGTGDGDPGPLRIHDIQGASWLVAAQRRAGHQRARHRHRASAPAGSSRGYWIQDPEPGRERGDQRGHLRLHRRRPAVAVGDSVLVSGTVQRLLPARRAATPSRRPRTCR